MVRLHYQNVIIKNDIKMTPLMIFNAVFQLFKTIYTNKHLGQFLQFMQSSEVARMH